MNAKNMKKILLKALKEERKRKKMDKDTYILEIIAKAREWQKTKSITTSSEVCKMLNAWADEHLEKEEQ